MLTHSVDKFDISLFVNCSCVILLCCRVHVVCVSFFFSKSEILVESMMKL